MTAVTTDVKTAVPDVVVVERDERPALCLLDDPDAVEAWLRACGPHADVGHTCMARSCPLATYLQVHNKSADVRVTGCGYRLNNEPFRAGLWAGRFVFLVDRLPTTWVSADRALEILAVARDTQRHLASGPDPYNTDDLAYNIHCGCPHCEAQARP